MRKINYLRISVTDRCNLRCVYCMPETGVKFIPHREILSFEEIEYVVKILVKEGINSVRITGGEPLVRKGVIGLLKRIKNIEGINSISLTTNGILLSSFADELAAVELNSINISLDTLNSEQFLKITRVGDINDVLRGINAVLKRDFKMIKINSVIMNDFNLDQIIPLAEMSINDPINVRFIEYMPINGDREKFVSAEVIKKILMSKYDLEKDNSSLGNGPAYYYKIRNAKGHIGFITAMSNHFCSTCNRMRLTSDGKFRPCLLSNIEVDIKDALRETFTDRDKLIKERFYQALSLKPLHHKLVDRDIDGRRMHEIGG